jgi:hypothetical protein
VCRWQMGGSIDGHSSAGSPQGTRPPSRSTSFARDARSLTAVSDCFHLVNVGRTRRDMSPPSVLTIGHSTRSIDEFIRLLVAHRVDRLVDIRTIPRSRHNPQFSRDLLLTALRRAGIRYTHIAGLGGLRHPRPDSLNRGWRNAGFRGYADYMQTPAFGTSLERCINLARGEQIVLMCAEAVPWRCHRSLVADALLVRGVAVSEITSGIRTRPHSLTPWAEVKGTKITYPSAGASHALPPARRPHQR